MPYTQNPDMIAFTLGRVVLSQVQSGAPVDLEAILQQLLLIQQSGPRAGVSPDMARGAHEALRRLQAVA